MIAQFNPFTPHQPIDPEYFAGRIEEVQKIRSALNQTRHAKTQHVLLTGERGIGKTSLALYSQYLGTQPDFRFAVAYCTVERNQTLVDVCRGLTAKLLDGIDRSLAARCIDKLKQLKLHFSIHVPAVGDIGADAPEGRPFQAYLQADFVKAIEEAWQEIRNTHNGILLIVDELHNLKSFKGVGSFFKVVSEGWVVDGFRQIMFITTGLPMIAPEISHDDQSAPRIFTYVELKRMTEEESLLILNKCLAITSKRITNEAAKTIAKYSGGFPFFLHQLGYDAFEMDTDSVIDKDDVFSGLIKSLVQFERMFFGKMYKSVEGKQKQKIVDMLADMGNQPRTPSELHQKLKIKNIHQYLKSLEEDGIVEKLNGKFRLSSELLSIYVMLFKTVPRLIKEAAHRIKTTETQQSVENKPAQG